MVRLHGVLACVPRRCMLRLKSWELCWTLIGHAFTVHDHSKPQQDEKENDEQMETEIREKAHWSLRGGRPKSQAQVPVTLRKDSGEKRNVYFTDTVAFSSSRKHHLKLGMDDRCMLRGWCQTGKRPAAHAYLPKAHPQILMNGCRDRQRAQMTRTLIFVKRTRLWLQWFSQSCSDLCPERHLGVRGTSPGKFSPGKFFNLKLLKHRTTLFFRDWHQNCTQNNRPKLSTCVQVNELAFLVAKKLR